MGLALNMRDKIRSIRVGNTWSCAQSLDSHDH
jgi:hypothetical protein